uniref:B30.2/SPRY domain-containing protein n=1 Tax=Seriola dumerili TaxID=41447 RepID=A0A3B4V916_SERDU
MNEFWNNSLSHCPPPFISVRLNYRTALSTCRPGASLWKLEDNIVRPPSYEGTVVRAVAQLEETLSEEMKKLIEAELKRVQQYAEDVTLDPDTASPKLVLSDDGKQVNHGDVRKNLPDNPKRFSQCPIVLGKQSFSSGRFYFEVQVKGKTEWTLGVARESINRKGDITLSPDDGYWTIWLRNGNEYKALDDPSVRLSLKSQPEKVGVFVDYEEGLVSFYDVAAAALIYSFTGCSFTEKLYPYFSPCNNDGGENSTPLIICPTKVRLTAPSPGEVQTLHSLFLIKRTPLLSGAEVSAGRPANENGDIAVTKNKGGFPSSPETDL